MEIEEIKRSLLLHDLRNYEAKNKKLVEENNKLKNLLLQKQDEKNDNNIHSDRFNLNAKERPVISNFIKKDLNNNNGSKNLKYAIENSNKGTSDMEKGENIIDSIFHAMQPTDINKDMIIKLKHLFQRNKARAEKAENQIYKFNEDQMRLSLECEKLRNELLQRKTQLRLGELKSLRRPRMIKGERSNLIVRDDLWNSAIINTGNEDTSSIQSSLIGLISQPMFDSLAQCNYNIQLEWQESVKETVDQLNTILTGISRMLSQLAELGKQLHEDDVLVKVQNIACLLIGAEKAYLYIVENSGDKNNLILWTHVEKSKSKADGRRRSSLSGPASKEKRKKEENWDMGKEWIIVPMKRFGFETVNVGEDDSSDEDRQEFGDGNMSELNKYQRQSSQKELNRRSSFYSRLGVTNSTSPLTRSRIVIAKKEENEDLNTQKFKNHRSNSLNADLNPIPPNLSTATSTSSSTTTNTARSSFSKGTVNTNASTTSSKKSAIHINFDNKIQMSISPATDYRSTNISSSPQNFKKLSSSSSQPKINRSDSFKSFISVESDITSMEDKTKTLIEQTSSNVSTTNHIEKEKVINKKIAARKSFLIKDVNASITGKMIQNRAKSHTENIGGMGFVAHCIMMGKPFLYETGISHNLNPVYSKEFDRLFTPTNSSMMLMPIFPPEKTDEDTPPFAVLQLISKKTSNKNKNFTAEDEFLMQLLANHVSVLLRNTKLIMQLAGNMKTEEELSKCVVKMFKEPNIGKIANILAISSKKLVDAEFAIVYLSDGSSNKKSVLVPMTKSQAKRVSVFQNLQTAMEDNEKILTEDEEKKFGPDSIITKIARFVFIKEQYLSVDDLTTDDRFNKDVKEIDSSLKSVMCIPIMNDLNSKSFGVVVVGNKLSTSNKFRLQDVHTVKSLAHLGGVAIENSNLFNKSQDISAAFSSISGELKLHSIVSKVASTAARVMKAEGGFMYLVDNSKEEIYSFIDGDANLKLSHKFAAIDNSVAAFVIKTGKPCLTTYNPKLKNFIAGIDYPNSFKIKNLLCFPIYSIGNEEMLDEEVLSALNAPKLLGILYLYNKRSENEFNDVMGFTSDDKSFLPVLSNQIAGIVSNAITSMTKDILKQKALDMLDLIPSLMMKRNLKDVLDSICSFVLSLIGSETAYVFVRNEAEKGYWTINRGLKAKHPNNGCLVAHAATLYKVTEINGMAFTSAVDRNIGFSHAVLLVSPLREPNKKDSFAIIVTGSVKPFTEEQKETLQIISNQVSLFVASALAENRIGESANLLMESMEKQHCYNLIIDGTSGNLLMCNKPLNNELNTSSMLIDIMGNIVNLNLTDASINVQKSAHFSKWLGITSEIKCTKMVQDLENFLESGISIVRDNFNLQENKLFESLKDQVIYNTKVQLHNFPLEGENVMRSLNGDLIAFRRNTAPQLWKYISSYRVDWDSIWDLFLAEYQQERDSISTPLGSQISIKSFKNAINRLGMECSSHEMSAILNTYGDFGGQKISFKSFIRDMMPTIIKHPAITYSITPLTLAEGKECALLKIEPLLEWSS